MRQEIKITSFIDTFVAAGGEAQFNVVFVFDTPYPMGLHWVSCVAQFSPAGGGADKLVDCAVTMQGPSGAIPFFMNTIVPIAPATIIQPGFNVSKDRFDFTDPFLVPANYQVEFSATGYSPNAAIVAGDSCAFVLSFGFSRYQ